MSRRHAGDGKPVEWFGWEIGVGAIHVGPPKQLVLQLRDAFHLSRFVETGTCEGRTAAWAATEFAEVTTIEYSRKLFDQTARGYSHLPNVTFLFGDSRVVLRRVVATLSGPALFWLDSHWSGGDTHGENDECPLLGELAAIRGAAHGHFLLIDDARLFLSPPPYPHRVEQWPTLPELIDRLRVIRSDYYVVVIEDVLVAVPSFARGLVAEYCRRPDAGACLQTCANRGMHPCHDQCRHA